MGLIFSLSCIAILLLVTFIKFLIPSRPFFCVRVIINLHAVSLSNKALADHRSSQLINIGLG